MNLMQLQFGLRKGRNPQDPATNFGSRHQGASGVKVVDSAANPFPPVAFESRTVLPCQFIGDVTNVVKKLQKRRGHSTVGFNGHRPKIYLVPAASFLHGVGVAADFLRRNGAAVVPFVKHALLSLDTDYRCTFQSSRVGQTLPTRLDNRASEIDGVSRVNYPVDGEIWHVNVSRTQVPFVWEEARGLDSGRQTGGATEKIKFISNPVVEVGAGVGLATRTAVTSVVGSDDRAAVANAACVFDGDDRRLHGVYSVAQNPLELGVGELSKVGVGKNCQRNRRERVKLSTKKRLVPQSIEASANRSEKVQETQHVVGA